MTSPAGAGWYAIVDTAQDPALHALVSACRDVRCLVGGTIPPALAATLPHLVRLHPDEALTGQWRAVGAGRGWGIMVQTDLPIDALRRQLKKFLNATCGAGDALHIVDYKDYGSRWTDRLYNFEDRWPFARDSASRFVQLAELPATRPGIDAALEQIARAGGR